MGSLLFLTSWAVLLGPVTYGKHLVSTPRLPFTAVYFGSIALTLYFAIGVSTYLPSPWCSMTSPQLLDLALCTLRFHTPPPPALTVFHCTDDLLTLAST